MPAKPRPPVWLAGMDGTAHATRYHTLHTVCGLQPVQERLAWPRERYCERCIAGLQADPTERPFTVRKVAS